MKPRTQAELDAQAACDAAFDALGITEEQWNAGARVADATWWEQPHERTEGSNAPSRDDRSTPDGRDAMKDHAGYYRRKPGEPI